MSKWKKIMTLLVMGSMLVSSVGCGSSAKTDDAEKEETTADDSSAAEESQAEEGTDESGELVELSMLCDWTTDAGGQIDAIKSVAESLGYKLNVDVVDGDTYKTKIRVMLQANELPDIFYTWGGSYSTPFLEADALYPLEDALEASGYELLDVYNQRDEEGHIYAVPNGELESYALFYNKDVFEQLGMDVPANWDELLAVVEACNAQGIGTLGLGNKERWEGDLFYNMMVVREDVDAFENAVNGDGAFTDEAFLTAAEKVQTLVEMNAFQSGYMEAGQAECEELLRAGQIAMYPTGSWATADFSEDENIGCTVFPQTGEEDPYLYCCGNAADSGMAVNAYSENADAAAKLVVEYSKQQSELSITEGGQNWFTTEAECTVELPELVVAYNENFNKLERTQLWWYTYLDTAIGEPMRDLSHQQFAGQIEAEAFIEELETIINGS